MIEDTCTLAPRSRWPIRRIAPPGLLLLSAGLAWTACTAHQWQPPAVQAPPAAPPCAAAPPAAGAQLAPAPAPDAAAFAPVFADPDPAATLARLPPPGCPAPDPELRQRVTALLAGDPTGRKGEHELPDLLAALGGRAVEPLLDQLPGLAPPEQLLALQALGRLAHPCAVGRLLPLAVRGEPALARAAAVALATTGHPAALQAVALATARDDLPRRRTLIRRLADLGEQRAELRDVAVALLGWLTAPARQPSLRTAACEGLARLAHPQREPLLAWLLQHDADPLVRQHAAEGLVGLASELSLPTLVSALADPYGPVAVEAALALGQSSSPELALPALLAYLRSGRREAIEPVLQALAQRVDPVIAAELRPLLLDRDGYVQARAAQVLASLDGVEAAAGPLIDLLGNPQSAVRRAAAASLASLKLRRALPELERLARQDPDPTVKTVAAASAETLRSLP